MPTVNNAMVSVQGDGVRSRLGQPPKLSDRTAQAIVMVLRNMMREESGIHEITLPMLIRAARLRKFSMTIDLKDFPMHRNVKTTMREAVLMQLHVKSGLCMDRQMKA